MKCKATFLLLIILLLNIHFLNAQKDSLKIINAANNTIVFSSEDLKAMPQTTLNVEAEDGTPHNYSGIEIQLLLNKAGVLFGKEFRKQTLNSFMYIKAADGYSVVYALTEIDTALSNKQMIIALMKDGNALPQNAAPFQIIASGEKKHARMIRMVTEIDVRKAE